MQQSQQSESTKHNKRRRAATAAATAATAAPLSDAEDASRSEDTATAEGLDGSSPTARSSRKRVKFSSATTDQSATEKRSTESSSRVPEGPKSRGSGEGRAAGKSSGSADAVVSEAAPAKERRVTRRQEAASSKSSSNAFSPVKAPPLMMVLMFLELQKRRRQKIEAYFTAAEQFFFPALPGGFDELFYNWIVFGVATGLAQLEAQSSKLGASGSRMSASTLASPYAYLEDKKILNAHPYAFMRGGRGASKMSTTALRHSNNLLTYKERYSEEQRRRRSEVLNDLSALRQRELAARLADCDELKRRMTRDLDILIGGGVSAGHSSRSVQTSDSSSKVGNSDESDEDFLSSEEVDAWLSDWMKKDNKLSKQMPVYTNRLEDMVTYSPILLWNPLEIARFEVALCTLGQNFASISQYVKTKTYKESYTFYTDIFKQINRYRSFKDFKKYSPWYLGF